MTDAERTDIETLLAGRLDRLERIRDGLYKYPTATLLHERAQVRAEIANLEHWLSKP